jgi:hypothetical protein
MKVLLGNNLVKMYKRLKWNFLQAPAVYLAALHNECEQSVYAEWTKQCVSPQMGRQRNTNEVW